MKGESCPWCDEAYHGGVYKLDWFGQPCYVCPDCWHKAVSMSIKWVLKRCAQSGSMDYADLMRLVNEDIPLVLNEYVDFDEEDVPAPKHNQLDSLMGADPFPY